MKFPKKQFSRHIKIFANNIIGLAVLSIHKRAMVLNMNHEVFTPQLAKRFKIFMTHLVWYIYNSFELMKFNNANEARKKDDFNTEMTPLK